MSWLFSQALVEEYSEDILSDGEPYAQLNVMPTPHKFWRNDKMMDHSRLSRFGLTLRLLTEQDGEAVLTSFLGAFPARTYQYLEPERGFRGLGRGFGLNSLGSLAKYDPNTFLWKTPQFSLLGGSGLYSETWPRWGTMRSGECWGLPMSEETTTGKEYGYWATPTATDWKGAPKMETVEKRKGTHRSGVRLPEHIVRQLGIDLTNKLRPEWSEALMNWPIGWTDLEPSGTARFQEWQQQHSEF